MTAVSLTSVAAHEIAAGLPEREYRRLLQWPRGRNLPAELRERARGARQWYARHGRPFVASRRVGVRAVDEGTVALESGTVLEGRELAAGLRRAEAHALVVVVASAGPEVAAESARRWSVGLPDAAYFLDRLAAGVAERLVARAASGLCRELAPRREYLLPPRSPGCGDWALADQQRLAETLGDGGGPVTVLESGALSPQHSVLAVFGITRMAGRSASPLAACGRCDLEPCAFRRMPLQCRESPQ